MRGSLHGDSERAHAPSAALEPRGARGGATCSRTRPRARLGPRGEPSARRRVDRSRARWSRPSAADAGLAHVARAPSHEGLPAAPDGPRRKLHPQRPAARRARRRRVSVDSTCTGWSMRRDCHSTARSRAAATTARRPVEAWYGLGAQDHADRQHAGGGEEGVGRWRADRSGGSTRTMGGFQAPERPIRGRNSAAGRMVRMVRMVMVGWS